MLVPYLNYDSIAMWLVQVKSSQVKKFYWHKFIHFYNNHEVTETQMSWFVTTNYMTHLYS